MKGSHVYNSRMKLVGLMPVRNEDWILGLSLRAALMWVDFMVVLNHRSDDYTGDILDQILVEHPGRLHVITVHDKMWEEMKHRQAMLDCARFHKATHVAIIDADEILCGNLLPTIRQHVEQTAAGAILQLPGYNLRGGIGQYHSNGIWGTRWFSTAFMDAPQLGWSGDKFHSREPGKLHAYRPVRQSEGGVMHLWGASERRLIAKHRKFRIEEAIRWPDKSHAEIERMYSWATDGPGPQDNPTTWTFAETPAAWWSSYGHLMQHLNIDAVPWQEAWCDDMIERHGIDRFDGLRVRASDFHAVSR